MAISFEKAFLKYFVYHTIFNIGFPLLLQLFCLQINCLLLSAKSDAKGSPEDTAL